MSKKCEPENAEVFSCPTCGNEYDSHDAPAICETLRSSISDAQAVKAQAARIRDLVSDNEKLGHELVDYQTRAAELRAKLNALREETNRQDAVIVELRTMLKTVEAQRQHYAKIANEVTAQLRSVEAQRQHCYQTGCEATAQLQSVESQRVSGLEAVDKERQKVSILLAACKGMLSAFDNSTYHDQFELRGVEDTAIYNAREAVRYSES